MAEFVWESQGNWSASCPLKDPDPPVYSDAAEAWESERRGFVVAGASLNHFLTTLCVQEAVMGCRSLAAVGTAGGPAGAVVGELRPLWLRGRDVYGEPSHNFFAAPDQGVLVMDHARLWVGSPVRPVGDSTSVSRGAVIVLPRSPATSTIPPYPVPGYGAGAVIRPNEEPHPLMCRRWLRLVAHLALAALLAVSAPANAALALALPAPRSTPRPSGPCERGCEAEAACCCETEGCCAEAEEGDDTGEAEADEEDAALPRLAPGSPPEETSNPGTAPDRHPACPGCPCCPERQCPPGCPGCPVCTAQAPCWLESRRPAVDPARCVGDALPERPPLLPLAYPDRPFHPPRA
jgi:hypothetical protein